MRALGDCRRAAGTVALGAGLTLAASAFGSPSFYVPGVALIALGTLAVIWVALAARGATVVRVPGPPTVEEEAPYPVHVGVRGGRVPPPGGEVLDPLLGWPVPLSWRWPRRVRMNVRFERRGRRRLAPPRLVVCDPLGLAATEREVLEGAKAMLSSELAVVQDISLSEAQRQLDTALETQLGAKR
jgi:uncharacterized protein (DUF58 family)